MNRSKLSNFVSPPPEVGVYLDEVSNMLIFFNYMMQLAVTIKLKVRRE